MRIDYVTAEIVDALISGYPAVSLTTFGESEGKKLYLVSTTGTVFYVLEEDEIFFNMAKCKSNPNDFRILLASAPDLVATNELQPTLDMRASISGKRTLLDFLTGSDRPNLLARFVGNAWETFVNTDLLEAFDKAQYFQALPEGPVAVVEGGCLVGYVAPVKGDKLVNHYSDSPVSGETENAK